MRQKEKLQITFPVQRRRQLPVGKNLRVTIFFTRLRWRCAVTTEKSNEPATAAACSFDVVVVVVVACNVASIFRFVSLCCPCRSQSVSRTGLLKVTAVSLVSHALNQVLVLNDSVLAGQDTHPSALGGTATVPHTPAHGCRKFDFLSGTYRRYPSMGIRAGLMVYGLWSQ